jgi:hypothetical protein
MHNQPAGNPATVAALPSIIAFYRDRGYTFVDVAGRTRFPDRPVTDDWDGNRTATPRVVRCDRWFLRNADSTWPGTIAFSPVPG